MLMHKYRRFETQCTNYHTQSPMWSDYEILFIAIILTVCYNDSRWDKKAEKKNQDNCPPDLQNGSK